MTAGPGIGITVDRRKPAFENAEGSLKCLKTITTIDK